MSTPNLSIAGTPAASPLGYFSWTSGQLGRDPYYILVVIYIFFPYFSSVVVGDPVYGQRRPDLGVQRPFLHAAELAFNHPGSEERVTFHSPLASDLQAWLDAAVA